MPPLRRPNEGLLARVNFPLYSVEMLSSRHVLVAGGGGSSKTGVANGFEIYEIYHNGDRFVAEEVIRHETGPSVVMNCAVRSDGRRSFLVAGQESHCQLYHVNTKIIDESMGGGKAEGSEEKTTVRQRRTSTRQSQGSGVEDLSGDGEVSFRRLSFDIKPGDSVQTDFLDREPIQRVVRLSWNCKLMATGGTDGRLRLWNFPRMTKSRDIAAHSKELDDLDFSPDGKLVVSIAKDGLGVVWDVATGKEAGTLTWQPPEGVKYLFKRCRFGVIEDKKKCRLFTLANPLGKSGRQRGFLQQWDPETGSLQRSTGVDESLSALSVRDDGRFVGIGTMFSGSVSIHIAFSLQRVLHVPNAHSMFVTGLQFLPVLSSDGPAISSDSEAAVLSISVDNRICIHSLQYRHTLPAWAAIILIIVILFLTFMLCSYMGL